MVKRQNFQRLIIEAAVRHGLSLRELSELAGVPYRTIQHWLHGDNDPGKANAGKIHAAIRTLERGENKPKKAGLIDLSGMETPVVLRWRNLIVTLEFGKEGDSNA